MKPDSPIETKFGATIHGKSWNGKVILLKGLLTLALSSFTVGSADTMGCGDMRAPMNMYLYLDNPLQQCTEAWKQSAL